MLISWLISLPRSVFMSGLKEKSRLDRLISLGIDKLGPTRLSMVSPYQGNMEKSGKHISVLMYHSISEDSCPGRHPYYQTHTPLTVFARHMEMLFNGSHIVLRLKEAVDLLCSPNDVKGDLVVITFDDAFDDFLTHALPILEKYEFPATVFVASGLVGKRNSVFLNKSCMSWDDLAGLEDHGIELGSHTISHVRLAKLSMSDMEEEIVASRTELQKNLGVEIDAFSCPYAFPEADSNFVKAYLKFLDQGGYRCGVTTRIGRASNDESRYLIRRLPINYADDDRFFAAKLNGSYDWMNSIQYLKKKIQFAIASGGK